MLGVREPDAADGEQTQKWLQDDAEAARLIGASWLLFSEQADEAKRALTQLLCLKTVLLL